MTKQPMLRGLCLLLLSLGVASCGDEPERTRQTEAPRAAAEMPPGETKGSEAAQPPVTTKREPAPSAAKPRDSDAKMAPTPGTVTRETELKERPFLDTKTLARLAPKTAVTIVDREGGWFRVVIGAQRGWVRLLHVSSQPAGSGATSKEELEAVAKMATGRAGAGNIASTTGIRGLSEEQLRGAEANPQELQRLDGYGADSEQAAKYARDHKLERRNVPYLPVSG